MVAGGFSNSKLPTVYHHLCGLCLARKRALASGFHLKAQLLIEPLASSLWKKLLRPLCWFRKSLRIIGSSELLFRNRATPELACRKGIFFLAFFQLNRGKRKAAQSVSHACFMPAQHFFPFTCKTQKVTPVLQANPAFEE